MDPIKVSVIVPVYNVEKYLEECIRSLLSQSLDGIEIIAVNDGSTDSCGTILQQLKEESKNKNFHIFEKENGGLSDARNFGFARARGEFVAFLDSDDFARPDFYETLYLRGKETGADVVASDILYLWPEGKEKRVSSHLSPVAEGEEIKKDFIRFYPAVWNKIYRRSLLEETGIRFKKGAWFEDVEFSHRLLPHVRRLASTKDTVAVYRQREGSVTARSDARLFDYLTNFESIFSYFKEKDLLPMWEKELEFATARYLLATFLKRAGDLPKEDFDRACTLSLRFLKEHFPGWRKNAYLKKSGIRGWYLRFFSRPLAKVIRLGGKK